MKIIAGLVSIPIYLYRFLIAPLLPRACRFYPSCSQYALDALFACGPFKGLSLTLLRLSRCHPYHPGGFDPVTASNPVREIEE